jgi:hypothetical protein
MSAQTGGRRRTLTAACGYCVAGHPNEVDALFRRHQRYCGTCTVNDIPEFNATAAKNNGWDGLGQNRKLISTYCASSLVHLNGTEYSACIKTNGHVFPTIDKIKDLSIDELLAFIEATPQKKKKQKKSKVAVEK